VEWSVLARVKHQTGLLNVDISDAGIPWPSILSLVLDLTAHLAAKSLHEQDDFLSI
jgi:hypothetical protein